MAFSKLLGRDAQELTPAQAGAAFSEEAQRIAREQNLDLVQAWKKARTLHPEAYARLCEGAQPTVTLANVDSARAVPAGKALFLPVMKLPPDTSDEIFACAWKANGGKPAPLKAKDVLTAIIAFVAGQEKLSIADARRQVLEKYRALAAAAGEQPPGQAAPGDAEGGGDGGYGAEFQKALARPEIANDPIRAHQFVMGLPGASERFATKRAVGSPQQVA